MIVNERMVTYINSLDRGNQGMLAELGSQGPAGAGTHYTP